MDRESDRKIDAQMNKKHSGNTKTGKTQKMKVLRRRSGKAVQVTNIFSWNETPTSYLTLLCLELLNLNRNECFLFLNFSMFHLVPFLSILDPIICLQINTLSLSFPFFLLPILSFVFLRLILSLSFSLFLSFLFSQSYLLFLD